MRELGQNLTQFWQNRLAALAASKDGERASHRWARVGDSAGGFEPLPVGRGQILGSQTWGQKKSWGEGAREGNF